MIKRSLTWLLVISTLLFLSGCATGAFESNDYYTVQRGDTLAKIAATYNMNYVALARQNNLQYPYRLEVGQRLYVGAPQAGANYESELPARTHINMGTQGTVTPIAAPSQFSTQTLNLSQYHGSATKKQASAAPAATTTTAKPKAHPADGLSVSTQTTQVTDKITWAWPVNGVLIQSFGEGSNLLARGVQINVAPNTKILAAAAGQVIFSGKGAQNYGQMVIIKHGNNLLSAYTGVSKILVSQGQKVKLGQAIAVSGTIAGQSCLHFEIRKFGTPVDPLVYLPVPNSIKPSNKPKPISTPKMDASV